jgi:type II secretory pathway component PulF
MILTYEAVDTEGKNQRDRIEASDTREALDLLRRKGLFVTEIREESAGEHRDVESAAARADASARLPLKALTMFTRQMAMLMNAGSGIVPAISAIRRQMKKPGHAALLEEIVDDLQEGSTLAEALRKHPRTFDSTYCAIVQAGEASATLNEMFERLARMVGARKAMRNKLLGALAYPCLLIAMSIKIIFALLFFVLPRFADMFKQLGAEVPALTQAMLSLSEAMRTYWYGFAAGAVGLVVLVVWAVRSDVGKRWFVNIQTEIPIVGKIFARLIQAQVFRTLGLLLEARVGVLDSLELSRGVTSNARFQHLFARIEEAVTSGGQFSTACESSGIIEPYICQAIKTGEDSGNLGMAISYSADMLDEGNTELVQAATKLIEPLILIGMGLVVGTVAVSLFMPLFDLTSTMH